MTEKRPTELSVIQGWDQIYQQTPLVDLPWYYPQLDHDLDTALHRLGSSKGAFLDIGAGPATQTLRLAELGFTVTAIDLSFQAVEQAKADLKRLAPSLIHPASQPQSRQPAITILQDDILAPRLRGSFDYAFDRGCLHVLPPKDRPLYRDNLARLIRPGGWLFVKVFSHLQPGTEGPWRFKEAELAEALSGPFELQSLHPSEFQGNHQPPPKALFSSWRRAL